ncbi:hypothetical protein LOC67_12560 [Stieleria sp. JC731]|uniref:hypothetical protein n=1 Tax=Pirellulaceae TaxID=2691357 RepID=UPI001E47F3C1|nr:hypothetical protein [Stieleria sp. JC731]MCC9601379.1 hypothetical protein [Stieleria sp. JC731]
MNKRPLMIVLAVLVTTSAGGCTPFRNFFFGRGAECGLCTRVAAPFRRTVPVAVAPAPTCNTPAYAQPVYAAPYNNACGCGPAVADGCSPGGYAAYGPYDGGVIGNGVAPGYYYNDGQWVPRQYQANYGYYTAPGYRVDEDGDRIIFEEPLPPGASTAK